MTTNSSPITLECLTDQIICEGLNPAAISKDAPIDVVRKYISDYRQKLKWMQRNLSMAPAGTKESIALEKDLTEELGKLKKFISDHGFRSEAEAMGYTPPKDSELAERIRSKAKELGINKPAPPKEKISDESDGSLPPDTEREFSGGY